jgi:hypothetical protein
MSAEKRWPGGALQRADRAGMELQAAAAFHPDFHPSQRRMQATRLANRHGLSRQRALLIAEHAYGETRE